MHKMYANSLRTQLTSITKTNLLMVLQGTFGVYCENSI